MAETDGDFAEVYGRYVDGVIKPTRARVDAILKEWERGEEYWAKYADHSPIVPRPVHGFRTRIKRPEALLDKFQRLSREFPEGVNDEALRRMRDVLGARVIVYFLSQVTLIDREIRTGRYLEVHPDVRPRSFLARSTMERIGLDPRQFTIKGVKPSGYASVHYFLRLKEPLADTENPIFELQVRTMVEDVWSEVEHQLGYKEFQGSEFNVARQFRVISSHLNAVDDHFDYIYDRLKYLQSESDPQPDDEMNAENLPQVLAKYECRLLQGQVDRLLEILNIHRVKKVRDLRARARPEIVEAVKAEYHRLTHGQQATAFDLVAALVYLQPGDTEERAREVTRSNLSLVDLTQWSREPEGQPPPTGD